VLPHPQRGEKLPEIAAATRLIEEAIKRASARSGEVDLRGVYAGLRGLWFADQEHAPLNESRAHPGLWPIDKWFNMTGMRSSAS
jgi:hypothetical protein